jgi:hypothetical protein
MSVPFSSLSLTIHRKYPLIVRTNCLNCLIQNQRYPSFSLRSFELLSHSIQETLETQKEKLQAYEELLTTIFSEQFEIPNEDSPQDGTEETNQMNVVEKDVAGNENGVRSENISTTANGIQENPKRRGRSRSQSAERGEFRRSKTGGSYLDLFDIVNMTYEEYLEAYRSVMASSLLCFTLSLILYHFL